MISNGKNLMLETPIRDMVEGKITAHGTSYGLGEAGYDIRIRQDVSFRTLLWLFPFHKVGNSRWKFGRFCLASAIEEFVMSPNLVGVVHDKSTWARRGLSVFNTVIEPGWMGYLTLELVYHKHGKLTIPAGSGIAQVMFHHTTEPALYNGKYQKQEDMPVPARDSL